MFLFPEKSMCCIYIYIVIADYLSIKKCDYNTFDINFNEFSYGYVMEHLPGKNFWDTLYVAKVSMVQSNNMS